MNAYVRMIAKFQEAQKLGNDTSKLYQSISDLFSDFYLVPEFYYLPLEVTTQLILDYPEKYTLDQAVYIIENYARIFKRDCSESIVEIKKIDRPLTGLDILVQVKKLLNWPETQKPINVKPPIDCSPVPKIKIEMMDSGYIHQLEQLERETEEEMFRLNSVRWEMEAELETMDYKMKILEKEYEKNGQELLDKHNESMSQIKENGDDLMEKIKYVENRLKNPITEEQHIQILKDQSVEHQKTINDLNEQLKEQIEIIKEQLKKHEVKKNDPERQRAEALKRKEEYIAKKEAEKRAREEEKARKIAEREAEEAFQRSLVEVPQIIYDDFEYPEKIIKIQPIYKPKEPQPPKHPKTIFDAIYANNIEKAKEIIKRRKGIVNEYGDSRVLPLQQATKYNRPEIMKLLLENGADINSKDLLGRTPLHYAIINDSTELVGILQEYDPKPGIQDKDGKTPVDLLNERKEARKTLSTAVQEDNRRQMADIFKRWPDMINLEFANGMKLIHIAAAKGHSYAIELLVQYGADLEARDKDGLTPFHYATKNHQDQAIQFLLDHGADFHALDNNNKQPFDYYQYQ